MVNILTCPYSFFGKKITLPIVFPFHYKLSLRINIKTRSRYYEDYQDYNGWVKIPKFNNNNNNSILQLNEKLNYNSTTII